MTTVYRWSFFCVTQFACSRPRQDKHFVLHQRLNIVIQAAAEGIGEAADNAPLEAIPKTHELPPFPLETVPDRPYIRQY